MQTMEIQVFRFNELSPKVREKLVLEYEVFHGWYEDTEALFHSDLKEKGFYDVDSRFSGFYSQGDGASFSAKISPEGLKKLGYFDNLRLACSPENGPQMTEEELEDCDISICTSGSYCHSFTMKLEVQGNWACSFYEFYGRNSCDFLDHCRGLADEYYKNLKSEYEYLTSEEEIFKVYENHLFDVNGRFMGYAE